jgi:hypothetical protein
LNLFDFWRRKRKKRAVVKGGKGREKAFHRESHDRGFTSGKDGKLRPGDHEPG